MDNIAQRDVALFQKRLRSTTSNINIRIPNNIREKVGTTTFDTNIDYFRYIDCNHMWNLFEFNNARYNVQFKRTFLWKNNAFSNIKKWNEDNDIRLKESIVKDINDRMDRFISTFKKLDTMFVNNMWVNNDHNFEKFKKIRARINTIVRLTSQKRMLFCIKPKESKHFIDLLYDGLFSGKKWLEYIDNEYDLFDIIDKAVSAEESHENSPEDDDDIEDEYENEPPPLSSSSSSSSDTEESSDIEDEDEEDAKRRRCDIEEEDTQQSFDISQVLPEPVLTNNTNTFDLLSFIQKPFAFDREIYIETAINEAIMLSQKIILFLQDIFSRDPCLFVHFITKFHYTNHIFTLVQIQRAIRSSKYEISECLTKATIKVMSDDIDALKKIPKTYFTMDDRQQYADLMQKMFDLLYSIL